MFAVVGTVPDETFPLFCGPVTLEERQLQVADRSVAINRGTPALLATACRVCEFLGAPPPIAFLIGDIGTGAGSRKLYDYLEKNLPGEAYAGLTFHYIQPDVDWHNRVLFAVQAMAERPTLIADAGFMYAAKMSGQASVYDLFTPDIGELAFLADESAPHPFYTRGFIFHENTRAPELIARAYQHDNAACYLLVKGEEDLLAEAGDIVGKVAEPIVPALEAIGGTGDIVTGLAAALTGTGRPVPEACLQAAEIGRVAGKMARANPGTQVVEIIEALPDALQEIFSK